jgi:hypothetical protein
MKGMFGFLIAVVAIFISSASLAQQSNPILDSDAQISDSVPMGQVAILRKMVKAEGYSCDTVSAVTPFAMSRGFHVICNNWEYSYELADHGGKWSVTVKD